MARPLKITAWKRIFRRKDLAVDLAEHVIEEQAFWERHHPVPYAPDQRLTALTQRATQANGGAPSADCLKLLKAACDDWKVAAQAAEETR